MLVHFNNTAYARAVIMAHNNSEEAVLDVIRQKQGFCGDVGEFSSEKFAEEYDSEGWLCRKVVALPMALWSGVVLVIYDLAKLVIVGIYKLISQTGGGKYLWAQTFHIIRDLEKAFGHILLIFNDYYGSALVQEAEFQKRVYELNAHSDVNSIDYAALRESDIKALFPQDSDDTTVKLALLTRQEFQALLSNPNFPKRLRQRIPDSRVNDVDYENLRYDPTLLIFTLTPQDGEPLSRMGLLSSENLNAVINSRNFDAYRLIPASRFPDIDMTRLSQQVKSVLLQPCYIERYTSEQVLVVYDELTFDQLCRITEDQLQHEGLRNKHHETVLTNHRYWLRVSELIPISQIPTVDVTRLNSDQMLRLFEFEPIDRIRALTPDQVLAAYDKLSIDQRRHLTEEQLRNVELQEA